MIKVTSSGSYKHADNYFKDLLDFDITALLMKYGFIGVDLLRQASPKDTGLMADSWSYDIHHGKSSASLWFTNSDVEHGCNVAILVQYGHGTRGGTYVSGVDFINPPMNTLFQQMLKDFVREVKAL